MVSHDHALATPYAATQQAYDGGWHAYLAALKPVPASAAAIEREYLASALVLAAGEDKRHPGAFVGIGLCRADVHAAVNGGRVDVDDFQRPALRQSHAGRALAGGGRAGQADHRRG